MAKCFSLFFVLTTMLSSASFAAARSSGSTCDNPKSCVCKTNADCETMFPGPLPENTYSVCQNGFCVSAHECRGNSEEEVEARCLWPACVSDDGNGCYDCQATGTPGCQQQAFCHWGSSYKDPKTNKCFQWVFCEHANEKLTNFGPYEIKCGSSHDLNDPNLPPGLPYPRLPSVTVQPK